MLRVVMAHFAEHTPLLTRRRWFLGAIVASAWSATSRAAPAPAIATRTILSSGEALPVIGLGSWITFNVGNDRAARDSCTEVVRAFFAEGGRMIDSSPMYGSSQPVIGEALQRLGRPAALFSAEKVWTGDGSRGAAQIEASRAFWGVARFDLMQVHNLLAWQQHLPLLFEMKASGRLRYVGITTSEGRRHAELEQLMRTQPIEAQLQELRIPARYVPGHSQGRRRVVPVAAADCADYRDLHKDSRVLRHGGAGRLWHGLAA